MLALSRGIDQAIVIDNTIYIWVVEIHPQLRKVKLKFQKPEGCHFRYHALNKKEIGDELWLSVRSGFEINHTIKISIMDIINWEGVLKIRMGIECPRETSVHRVEIKKTIEDKQPESKN